MAPPPRVSVITVCWNAAAVIRSTLDSVLGQTYPNIESIVVDGASKDGTEDILSDYRKRLAVCISENDEGVYDAMNKGVQRASGDWVLFMNAGDMFDAPTAVADVFARRPEADLIFGHHVVTYPDGLSRLQRAGSPGSLWKGMICSHQALFTRAEQAKARPFSIGNLAADFEFIYGCWAGGARLASVDVVVARVSSGGMSDTRRLETIRERLRLVAKTRPKASTYAFYSYILIDAFARMSAKRVLSERAKSRILRAKYRGTSIAS